MSFYKIFYTLLFVILSNSVLYSQENVDLFKASMKECNITWLQEKYEDTTFEVLLDVFNGNHKEILKFKYIEDAVIVEDSRKMDAYIRNIYYSKQEVLHTTVARTEDTNMRLYVFITGNGENPPKNDEHSVCKICGKYYLVSYFSV